ncbi:MAG TPA: DUF4233 domain-containing protein [Beutenbergiaceae bacterium]|nr:DUF4233 domain-containing protein [Beutenbergiaceae bacterium]
MSGTHLAGGPEPADHAGGPGATDEAGASEPSGQPRAQRSARVIFCATVLGLEAFVVLFAALVAIGLELAEPAVVWTVTGIAALACLVLAGLVRYRAALVLGSLVQVGLIAAGLVIPMMYFVGGIFAVIWVVALRLGNRIDVERAERARAESANPASSDPDVSPPGQGA